MPQHAIVQHSGYGYGNKSEFQKAVEHRTVSAREAQQVKKVGGVLFDDWAEADSFCDRANYPDSSYAGLIPNARGTFSEHKVDGLAIYIPVTQVVG